MTLKPHAAPALLQIRRGVTFAAAVVMLCAIVQFIVFGFVHFTSVRWEERPRSAPSASATGAPLVVQGSAGVSPAQMATPATERQLSAADDTLRDFSGLACAAGSVAALVLAAQLLLGAMVASGGCVPGVERTVSAAGWGVMCAAISLPVSDVFPSLALPGIFGSYALMTHASSAADADLFPSVTLVAMYAALPLTVVAALGMVLARFHAGVEHGCIVTAPSELDALVEREAAALTRKGVALAAPKAVGALNRAIGESPSTAPVRPAPLSPPPDAEDALRELASRAKQGAERSLAAPTPGERMARPI